MPNAYSIYEELVYSETVEDRDVIEIEGSTFKFRFDSVSKKAFIEIDAYGVIIGNGECKIKDNFDICVSKINFSYRNYATYIDTYKALVKVYQIKSKLDITTRIDKNNILIDEEATATLTLENIADIAAEDVTAVIDVPPNLLITDVEGCKKIFNSVVFQDNVHKGTRTCTYKIIGLSGGDFELVANVSYFDGIEKISATSDTISGKVYNQSLKISPKLNKSKFNIQEKLDLTIDIQNTNDQYDITITNFNIKIPLGLLIVKKPRDAIINNRIITWSGTLATNETKSFVVKLESRTTGNYSILTEASYKIGKFLRKTEASTNIDVSCDCPYIIHDFSKQITVPDQRIRLNAFIINPSDVHTFLNLNLNYITNIPNIQDYSAGYVDIKPLQTVKIFASSIITPPLDKIYYFNITSTFDSSAQTFVVKANIIIKIPEEKKAEEQQEVEEVSFGTEEPIEETKEIEKNKTDEEKIPVTIIEDEEVGPFKSYVIIIFIALIIFILVVIIIFKRKRSKKIEKDNDAKELEAIESIEHGGSKEKYFKYLEQKVRNIKGDLEEDKQKREKIFKKLFKKKQTK